MTTIPKVTYESEAFWKNELLMTCRTPEGLWKPIITALHLPRRKQEAAVRREVAKQCAKGCTLAGYLWVVPSFKQRLRLLVKRLMGMEKGYSQPFGLYAVMECTREQLYGKDKE